MFLLFAFHEVHFGNGWHVRDYYFYSAMKLWSSGLRADWGAWWVAIALPWFESLLGILLLAGSYVRLAGAAATGFLVGLTCISVSSELRFGNGLLEGAISPLLC
jgi:hypothetical protein